MEREKVLTGPEFKEWADKSGIDRKVMADDLEISVAALFSWFRTARLKRHVAMAIRYYTRLVKEQKAKDRLGVQGVSG